VQRQGEGRAPPAPQGRLSPCPPPPWGTSPVYPGWSRPEAGAAVPGARQVGEGVAGPGWALGVALDAAELGRAEPEALLKRVSEALQPALLSEELLQLKAELLLWARALFPPSPLFPCAAASVGAAPDVGKPQRPLPTPPALLSVGRP